MSQPIVQINIAQGLGAIVAEFGATAGQIDRALKSSVRRLQGWMNTQLARALGTALDINQGAIKARMKKSAVRIGGTNEINASIWIGINPIEAQRAGAPRQQRAGAKVKGRLFAGAFTASIYTEDRKVWIRQSSKLYDPEKYEVRGYRARPGNRFGAQQNLQGSGRFPVVLVRIPIAEDAEKFLPQFEAPAAREFEKIFEHELKFAMGWFSKRK